MGTKTLFLLSSGLACTNAFWKQMEPYFAHLTPADMLSLHQLVGTLSCFSSLGITCIHNEVHFVKFSLPLCFVVSSGLLFSVLHSACRKLAINAGYTFVTIVFTCLFDAHTHFVLSLAKYMLGMGLIWSTRYNIR